MTIRGNFQILGLAAVLAVIMSVDVVMAQSGRPGRTGGGSIFGEVTQLHLLSQSSVQKELKLVEDQRAQIVEFQSRQRTAIRELLLNMRDEMQGKSDDERKRVFEGIKKKIKQLNSELEVEAIAGLLPHQKVRLKQILAQAQTRQNGGPTSGRLAEALAKELGLTKEQEEKLKAKAEESRKKLMEDIAKLQAQAEKEILSTILTVEQQAKYEELMGSAFKFEDRVQDGSDGGRGGKGRDGRRGGDQKSDF